MDFMFDLFASRAASITIVNLAPFSLGPSPRVQGEGSELF